MISLEQAKDLVAAILDPREKCIVVTLLKTGMRRHELSELDVGDVDIANKTIRIKKTKKRSNRIVFFDDEAAYVLQRWLRQRENENYKKNKALFLDRYGNRLAPKAIARIVVKHATAVGIHHPDSDQSQDHFSPHCCRYFWNTQLLDNDMPERYVKFLRGDAIREAVNIYYRPDLKKVKAEYLRCMPSLGII